ncbi:hypothetical protein G8T60_12725 [Clostridium botulinum C]|uniref:hypothetical protein n=1 Tax=Clostridium botulinum TaxID=1491 RepID=UPI001E2BA45F|nr:hypothetical protein [Clostridium botulinum]MCD3206753.1 hypothetical protein [Clostridium botulinum C]MCD3209662.1 hypothetical protein [Clostridium botulinum C]MCD3226553.1 hypothetical protein [Clostridium botulinum C]MCD3248987.1 hypothetical protein [Clostridium botulinum C]MCD3257571.1 hypothetical protein [Clostridium botulinum C]
MARGRKKTVNPLNEVISIRVTKAHKELLDKNKNIKKEIDIMIRNFLNVYLE